MAVPGNTQALIATFAFGMVVTVASAAVFLHIKGNGSFFFRDGLRLVLVLFLASSALAALIQFIATLVSADSTSGCQVAIVFASAFDQLARVSLEQYLLWSVKGAVDISIGTLLPQLVILARFILGAVFVGVQRPQFAPVCTTTTLVVPLGVVVIVIDVFIVFMLLTRAYSAGFITSIRQGKFHSSRSKSILILIGAMGNWLTMSIPMLLGLKSIGLAFRTVVPALGLFAVIVIVIALKTNLELSDTASSDLGSEDNRWLDFNNPRRTSNRAGDREISAVTGYSPREYSEVKEESIRSNTAMSENVTPSRNGALPIISRPSPGQAYAGVGGVPVQGQLFPPMRSQTEPVMLHKSPKPYPRMAVIKDGKLVISSPVLDINGKNHLDKVPTVDLATAAKNDKERRDMVPHPLFANTTRAAPSPPKVNQSGGLKRKDVEIPVTSATLNGPFEDPAFIFSPTAMAATSSSQLSPGGDEVRRRSPRMPSSTFNRNDQSPQTSPKPTRPRDSHATVQAPHIASLVLKPPAKSPKRPPSAAVQPLQSPTAPEPWGPLSPGLQPQSSVDITSPKRTKPSGRVFTDPTSPPQVPPKMPPAIPLRHPERLSAQPVKLIVPPVAPLQLSPRRTNQNLDFQPFPKQQDGRDLYWPTSPYKNFSHPNSPQYGDPRASRTSGDRLLAPKSVYQMKTGGLPSNPRAHFTNTWVQDQVQPQEQTVMFINSIEYDDPKAVKVIMDSSAAKMYSQSPNKITAQRDSVVHRPRPIPRSSVMGHSIWPSEEPSHFHMPKDIDMPSASEIAAALPMEFVPEGSGALPGPGPTLFYDAPAQSMDQSGVNSNSPNMAATGVKRKPLPSSTESPDDHLIQESAEQILSPAAKGNLSVSRKVSKFSVDTTYSPVLETDGQSGRLSGRLSSHKQSSYGGSRRQSSPVLPIEDLLSPPVSADLKTGVPWSVSDYESVYSPAEDHRTQPGQPQNTLTARMLATEPTRVDDGASTGDDDKETMTIMLDPSTQHHITPRGLGPGNDMSCQDGPFKHARFHRLVGEKCPTFSDRNMMPSRARTVPLPAPLWLNKPFKMPTVIAAEPSPLESPREALGKIQEQLKNFRESSADPEVARDFQSDAQQRMTLLADLEMEMGVQEDRWNQMRQDLSSLSPSGTNGSPNYPSQERSAAPSPRSQSMLRPTQTAKSGNISPTSQNRGSARNTSASHVPNNNMHWTSTWRRSGDSYTESGNRRPKVPGSAVSIMNMLSVPNRGMLSAQLGSPTPPDTDVEDSDRDGRSDSDSDSDGGSDSDMDMIINMAMDNDSALKLVGSPEGKTGHLALWLPVLPTSELPIISSTNPLWTPNAESAAPPQLSTESYVRPMRSESARTKTLQPLQIESSELWTASSQSAVTTQRSGSGLWRNTSSTPLRIVTASTVPPKPVVTRPRTQKPPRRAKRISLLPDILENPEPLFNKRGTLALYQFPWGEKSDTATLYPQAQTLMTMPGTMSSAGSNAHPSLNAPIRTLASQEHSSSFFDPYDEENTGDNFAEYEDSSEPDDDDFDETTLWEIASLLRTDSVPSRDSLLPDYTAMDESARLVETLIARLPKSEQNDDEDYGIFTVGLDTGPLPQSPLSPMLWSINDKFNSPPAKTTGLAQPMAAVWDAYVDQSADYIRAPTRKAEPTSISSTALWAPVQVEATAFVPGSLWSSTLARKVAAATDSGDLTTQHSRTDNFLWTRPVTVKPSPKGLPQSAAWNTYLIPKGASVQSKPRLSLPASVESTSLWKQPSAKAPYVHQQGMLWYSTSSSISHDNESREVLSEDNTEKTARVSLWTAPIIEKLEEPKGLFSISHRRSDFRTTTQRPAALDLHRVVRIQEEPLQISSSSLWSPPTQHSFEHDWITLSSVRPGTPATTSTADNESVTTDFSSVKSNYTGASTLGSIYQDDSTLKAAQPAATAADWQATFQQAVETDQELDSQATLDEASPQQSKPTSPHGAQNNRWSRPATVAATEASKLAAMWQHLLHGGSTSE